MDNPAPFVSVYVALLREKTIGVSGIKRTGLFARLFLLDLLFIVLKRCFDDVGLLEIVLFSVIL